MRVNRFGVNITIPQFGVEGNLKFEVEEDVTLDFTKEVAKYKDVELRPFEWVNVKIISKIEQKRNILKYQFVSVSKSSN
jgi:hypothetical protein